MCPNSSSDPIQGPYESVCDGLTGLSFIFGKTIVNLMKIPCELVVWYVLPTIRREVARELVNTHGMSQAEVARKFGVTDAAISQYLKKKRGENPLIEESPQYSKFEEEIKASAERIANDSSEFANEMCRICTVVKSTGMLAKIYEVQMGCKPPTCACDSNIVYPE